MQVWRKENVEKWNYAKFKDVYLMLLSVRTGSALPKRIKLLQINEKQHQQKYEQR